MVTSITKEVNLIFNAEMKSSKRGGFSASASKDVEETQAEVNKKVQRAANSENITHMLTESLLTVPKIIPSIVGAMKIIVPLVMGALVAVPVLGKVFGWFDEISKSKDSSDMSTDKYSSLTEQTNFAQQMMQDQTNFSSQTQPQQQSATTSVSTPSLGMNDLNLPTNSATITPVNEGLSSSSATSSVTNQALPAMEQDAKTNVKLDISDFEKKVASLNSLDMTTGINKLTSAITKSVSDEKVNMLSLFPVYENFSNLLAKVVGQLQFIANPTTSTSVIDNAIKQYTTSMYGQNSSMYQSGMADAKNISAQSGYYVYGNTVADTLKTQQATANNPQITSKETQ